MYSLGPPGVVVGALSLYRMAISYGRTGRSIRNRHTIIIRFCIIWCFCMGAQGALNSPKRWGFRPGRAAEEAALLEVYRRRKGALGTVWGARINSQMLGFYGNAAFAGLIVLLSPCLSLSLLLCLSVSLSLSLCVSVSLSLSLCLSVSLSLCLSVSLSLCLFTECVLVLGDPV